jgi:hypothetical protein
MISIIIIIIIIIAKGISGDKTPTLSLFEDDKIRSYD